MEKDRIDFKYKKREVTESALRHANIPRRLWNTDGYKDLPRRVLDPIQKWMNCWTSKTLEDQPPSGLFFIGKNDHSEELMVEILKRVYARQRKIFCASIDELDKICKDDLYPTEEKDTFRFLIESVHCLGIYDFPSKGNRFGGVTMADRVIARRWDAMKPTIFVTKLDKEKVFNVMSSTETPLNVTRAIMEYTIQINMEE